LGPGHLSRAVPAKRLAVGTLFEGGVRDNRHREWLHSSEGVCITLQGFLNLLGLPGLFGMVAPAITTRGEKAKKGKTKGGTL
jgi:hypothetical protein